MSKKKYDGYRSYSYLKEGEDYQAIPLAQEIDRVASATVELSDAEEKRARAILDREQIVSMHDHTSIFPEDMGRVLEQRRQGRDATGYAGLAASHADIVFENVMDGTATITSNKGWKLGRHPLRSRDALLGHRPSGHDLHRHDLPRSGAGESRGPHRLRPVARSRHCDRERDRPRRRAVWLRRARHGHHRTARRIPLAPGCARRTTRGYPI